MYDDTPTGRTTKAGTARHLAIAITQALALPVEVLLRRRMGERYLSPFIVLLSLGILHLFLFTMRGAAGMAGGMVGFFLPTPRIGALYGPFVGLVVLATALQYASIWYRRWKDVRWHSRSPGLSWPPWYHLPVSEETIQTYLEPALVVVVALVLDAWDPFLATMLQVFAMALLAKGLLQRWQNRQKILDAQDAMIEAEEMQDVVLADKPAAQAHGFRVAGGAPKKPEERHRLYHAMRSKLDRGLRELQSEGALPGAGEAATATTPPPPPGASEEPHPVSGTEAKRAKLDPQLRDLMESGS